MNTLKKKLVTALVPLALVLQGLGVNTPVLFNFIPRYRPIFLRLWERHKNPVSWVCRPFFGLLIAYGAAFESWQLVAIGVLAIGTSWFWFPKLNKTPTWAEQFINKEFEVLTPDNRLDLKRVVVPSIGLPIGLAGFAALLWFLSYPWNWLGILILVLVSILKIIWSARLEGSVARPVTWITLTGFGLGAIVGTAFFFLYT